MTADLPRRPVKVCLAAELFFPAYGGPAVRFRRYLPGLQSRGVELEVFSGTPTSVKASMSGVEQTWSEFRLGERMPEMDVDGVRLHRVRLQDTGRIRRSFLFGRRLARFCVEASGTRRPQVVQLLSLGPGTIPALNALRRTRIPTVFTLTMVPELSSNPVKRFLQRRYVVHPLKLVSQVVVSSEIMRENLAGFRLDTPVDVIPNGVETTRFRPAAPDEKTLLRETMDVPRDARVVLFVGPVSPRKGVDLLVEAWSGLATRYSDLHLVIVGPRRDAVDEQHSSFHERIQSLISRSGATDRVHFTGLVENVQDYLRAADYFVFPSRREGMPNVFAEAMASGLPLISTPFLGLPTEFGIPGEHYLLVERDVEALAAALEHLLDEPAFARALGEKARSWVMDHLAVEHSLDAYATLYRDLATRTGAAK